MRSISVAFCAAAIASQGMGAPALGQATCEETQKLLASDGGPQDAFGISTAIDGDRLVVGSLWDDDNGFNAGAMYVYERTDAGWIETAKLLALDGAANDNFGRAVAISGDRVIGGASGENAAGAGSGSAYIFELVEGVWTQVAKLSGQTAGPSDVQGWSASIGGDVAVLSAHRDDDRGFDAGAAYVFERTPDGDWKQTAKLAGSDTNAADEFGHDVFVAGDGSTILIGAHETTQSGADSGSAYVFVRDGGAWAQQAKLFVDEPTSPGSHFGRTVAIDGDRAVIGAPFEHPLNYGAAFVFVRTGSDWAFETKLTADVRTTQEWFGSCVDIDGDTLVSGSFFNSGQEPGSAFIFSRQSGAWEMVGETLASDGANGDGLGRHVGLSNGAVLTTASRDDDRGVNAGALYVFDAECRAPCDADLDDSGSLDFGDVLTFIVAFSSEDPIADIVADGNFTFIDVSAYLTLFSIGCP